MSVAQTMDYNRTGCTYSVGSGIYNHSLGVFMGRWTAVFKQKYSMCAKELRHLVHENYDILSGKEDDFIYLPDNLLVKSFSICNTVIG